MVLLTEVFIFTCFILLSRKISCEIVQELRTQFPFLKQQVIKPGISTENY